jgi:hypothetical protein
MVFIWFYYILIEWKEIGSIPYIIVFTIYTQGSRDKVNHNINKMKISDKSTHTRREENKSWHRQNKGILILQFDVLILLWKVYHLI